MKVIRCAAVAVTVLFALMKVGAAIDAQQAGWVRVFGAALGVAGAVAAFGLARNLTWGRSAVIAVGVANVLGSGAGMVLDQDGYVIGFVVGGLGGCSEPSPGGRTSTESPRPTDGAPWQHWGRVPWQPRWLPSVTVLASGHDQDERRRVRSGARIHRRLGAR